MQDLTWNKLMSCTFNSENTFLRSSLCFRRKNFFVFLVQCSSEHWQQQQPLGNPEIMFLQFSSFFFFFLQMNSSFSKVEQEVMPQTNAHFLKKKQKQKKNKNQATCQVHALPENTREEGQEVLSPLFAGSRQYGWNAERFRQVVLSLISHTRKHTTHTGNPGLQQRRVKCNSRLTQSHPPRPTQPPHPTEPTISSLLLQPAYQQLPVLKFQFLIFKHSADILLPLFSWLVELNGL